MSFLPNFTRFHSVITNWMSDGSPSKKRDRVQDNIPSTPPPSKRRRHEDILTPGQKILMDKRDKERSRRKMLTEQFIPIDLIKSFDFIENRSFRHRHA